MKLSWLAFLAALSACEFPRPADVLPFDAATVASDAGNSDSADTGGSGSDAALGDAASLDFGHQRVASNGIAQQAGDITAQMFSVRLDGTGQKQLTNEPEIVGSEDRTGAEFGTISLDGRYVVFAAGDLASGRQIIVQNSDGTGRRVLVTHRSSNDQAGSPVISTDGQRVAFSANREVIPNGPRNYNIYIASFVKGDADPVVRITPDGENYDHPSWGGNSKVAFDNRSDVMLVNADGTGLVNLTNNPALDTSPAFSHDGRKIAFISNRSGSNQAWIMNSDGSGPQQVTTTGAGSVAFDLTDHYLVYENDGGSDGTDFSMMIIGVDGSGKMKVTPTPNGIGPFSVYPE
jgi:Tol biopolymer transport system component